MADRIVDTSRSPIVRDGGIVSNSRTVPTYSGITNRDMSGRVIGEGDTSTPASLTQLQAISQSALQNAGKLIGVPWNPYTNQATAVSPTEPANTFYGTANPFLVLSDVFRNVFGSGGDVGQQKQVGQALVPVTSSGGSGSSSIILIVIVIGIAGFAYYYYKKQQ